ncbi:uncharacterized protein GGS25DRAFT_382421 [Hypoxylon fragiforme]|uniref:uncharacterized protein n=1 Tax=Hypoxylon fragiforme TaxID=63214 RepID=UPI0020C6EAB0|nr:uncharacterized protein GGS25DRAFT_382421 [Hypoxylon fragiforme]KAI2606275.1 hypothetical protein GGS25DRAFT_382421 [Hypoxylon fragiforme]
MFDRAQTFPLSYRKLAPESRHEEWMVSAATPYSNEEQKRVCYPNLEPWCAQDGERHLNSDLEETIKELRANDKFLGSKVGLQEEWSINFESAYRRLEGSDAANVPTIMLVAWSEDDREYDIDDEDLWIEACREIVTFLRDKNAAYFGVEIIHWDRLDYQVVTSNDPVNM